MPLLSKLYENRIVRAAIIIVLAVLAAVSVFRGAQNALLFSQDFQWDAAKALCMRLDPYELSKDTGKVSEYPPLAAFYKMFTDRGLTQKMEANQFPSLLFLLAPMTVFEPATARIVWLVCNLIFSAGIIFLLRRTFLEKTGTFEYVCTMLLMLAGTPYRNQLGVGQHTLFALFFFLLAVFIEKRSRTRSAGTVILISLCLFVSYFKYTLTAPLALYFVYKRRYRELVISVAGHVVLTAAAALWLGKSFMYMLTAPLSVASALVSEGGIDLGVLIGGPLALAAAFLIGIGLTVMTVYMPQQREYILFPILVMWSLILTYHRTYDFFVLSAVSMLFCDDFTKDCKDRFRVLLISWYAVLIAVIYFGLRAFSENRASLIGAGIIYYGFTAVLTWIGIKMIKDKKNE
ncbi:MAG: DUF2029 domain-containing protein [Lachnospiraceae bacterium]|nr:DUF2029 domain-containing protein [Lachnospiraceae bacterium]